MSSYPKSVSSFVPAPGGKMTERKRARGKADIYETYRCVLAMPELSDAEIDEMRGHVIRLTRTVCEHVWGKEFY